MNAKRSRMPALLLAGLLLWTFCAAAQTDPKLQHVVIAKTGESGLITKITGSGQGNTFTFVTTEMGFESKIVKGAPFLADTVTEFSQTLSNGQKIYRKSTATLARDSEGRTRREQTIDTIGPYVGTPRQTIFINDPVAGTSYTLDPENHVAYKMTISADLKAANAGFISHSADAGTIVMSHTSVSGGQVVTSTASTVSHARNSRTEALGTTVMGGITTEGTRTIETIPAGWIGNDAPIEIVTERWYSPDLGVVVKTIHNDPMTGENTYQVTNIRRVEPPPDLFLVPADYKVNEGAKVHIQTIKK